MMKIKTKFIKIKTKLLSVLATTMCCGMLYCSSEEIASGAGASSSSGASAAPVSLADLPEGVLEKIAGSFLDAKDLRSVAKLGQASKGIHSLDLTGHAIAKEARKIAVAAFKAACDAVNNTNLDNYLKASNSRDTIAAASYAYFRASNDDRSKFRDIFDAVRNAKRCIIDMKNLPQNSSLEDAYAVDNAVRDAAYDVYLSISNIPDELRNSLIHAKNTFRLSEDTKTHFNIDAIRAQYTNPILTGSEAIDFQNSTLNGKLSIAKAENTAAIAHYNVIISLYTDLISKTDDFKTCAIYKALIDSARNAIDSIRYLKSLNTIISADLIVHLAFLRNADLNELYGAFNILECTNWVLDATRAYDQAYAAAIAWVVDIGRF